jgi:cell division protein FtsB
MSTLDFIFNKETMATFGLTASVGLNGWMAFSRYWISNRAKNANDMAQVNMLSERGAERKELKDENEKLRDKLEEKDKLIKEQFKTLVDTQAELKIIKSSLSTLHEQYEAQGKQLLDQNEQIKELTKSNMNLVREVTELRSELREPR